MSIKMLITELVGNPAIQIILNKTTHFSNLDNTYIYNLMQDTASKGHLF